MKRIIDGKTYNIDTATRLAGGENGFGSLAWWGLYRTRYDGFFKVVVQHDGETTQFTPLNDGEALELLQEHAPHRIDECFGPFPEAGAAERRLTIRIPGSLAVRIETAAQAKRLSLNSYVMRCFERCAGEDGQPQAQT